MKGVSYEKRIDRYKARITRNNITITLGYYKTPEEAFSVYKKALFGRYTEGKHFLNHWPE